MDRIGYVDQFVMAYGGLRGGIAFSLCRLTCLQDVPAIKGVVNETRLENSIYSKKLEWLLAFSSVKFYVELSNLKINIGGLP